MIAQASECPSLMVKPTFCGQTRKVGNVPEADLRMTAQSANSRPIPIRAPAENLPETVSSDSFGHDVVLSIIPTRRNRAATSS